MPVKPVDFLSSAINILNNGSEIDFRNSVSRAYYAAFHEASRVSQYSNGVSKKISPHEKIIDKLKKHKGLSSKDNEIVQIGALLAMCKKHRVEADYDIKKQCSYVTAQTVINDCQHIINLAKNFP